MTGERRWRIRLDQAFACSERGQTQVEYVLLLVLLAVATLTVFLALAGQTDSLLASVPSVLGSGN